LNSFIVNKIVVEIFYLSIHLSPYVEPGNNISIAALRVAEGKEKVIRSLGVKLGHLITGNINTEI
jgi:hypothetical protein